MKKPESEVTLEGEHNQGNHVCWECRPVIQVICDHPLCCSPPLIQASVMKGFEKRKVLILMQLATDYTWIQSFMMACTMEM